MDKWNDTDMMTPRWMRITLTMCKAFMHFTPFVCCSVAMILMDNTLTLAENYMFTAMYCLSVIKLWDLVDAK